MIRLMSSTITVATGAGAQEVKSALPNLTDVIPSTALAKALGFKFTAAIPTDITVSYVGVRSSKNKERSYTIYQGATIKLADLEDLLKPDAAGTPFSVIPFNPEHGLEVVMTVEDGGATGMTAVPVVWKLSNFHPSAFAATTGGANSLDNIAGTGAGYQIPALIKRIGDEGLDVPGYAAQNRVGNALGQWSDSRLKKNIKSL